MTATARYPAFVAHTPEFDEVIGEWPRPSGSTSRPTHTHDASVPHTLVLAPGLVIDKVYVGYWFFGRPSAYQLWEDLGDLFRRIKADFDPTLSNVRETWEQALVAMA